jgi:hypothetical protein
MKGKNIIHFYCRFIDDIFIIWTSTRDNFSEFMEKVSLLHKAIKFTSEFDFDKRSTTFFDTTVPIRNGKVKTGLYRKETDKLQYLLPSSCCSSHIFKSVPQL